MVDASIVAKLLFEEEYSDKTAQLFAAAITAHERVLAPALLSAEVANFLRQRMRRVNLALVDALGLFDRFQEVPVSRRSAPTLSQRALILAANLNLPAAYDAHYLALAESHRCDGGNREQVGVSEDNPQPDPARGKAHVHGIAHVAVEAHDHQALRRRDRRWSPVSRPAKIPNTTQRNCESQNRRQGGECQRQ